MPAFSRRTLLMGLASLPAVAAFACSSDDEPSDSEKESGAPEIAPTITATPEPPFVVAAGEAQRPMMAGTPYETPLHVFGTGLPGEIIMLLGGVHGNEPGGWLAAERIVDSIRPTSGALLVIPRTNKLAINLFERTTDEMGDLNRSYPGNPAGKPMEVMAAEIIDTLREFHVNVLIDMHESWAFYNNRSQNGTAFLGQTVATYPAEPGISLARTVVENVNTRIQAPVEELFFRDRTFAGPNGTTVQTPVNPATTPGGSSSSLGLPRWVPNLSAILVEMGQQQPLERRIALHVDIVQEAMRLLKIAGA
jgi:hypothetical protein